MGKKIGSRFALTAYAALRRVEQAFVLLGTAAIFVMMLSTVSDVTGRTFINNPIGGVIELNELLMALVIYLGLARTQARGSHITIDLLVRRLPQRRRDLLDALMLLIALGFFVMLTYTTWERALYSISTGEYSFGLIRFPLWPSYLVLPIGCFVLCVRLAVDIILKIAGTRLEESVGPPIT